MIVVKLFAKVLSIFYIIMCHVLGLVYTNNFSSDELFGWFADIFFVYIWFARIIRTEPMPLS